MALSSISLNHLCQNLELLVNLLQLSFGDCDLEEPETQIVMSGIRLTKDLGVGGDRFVL